MWQIVEIGTLALLPLFIVLDIAFPHRRFSVPSWWKARAGIVTVVSVALSMGVAILWGMLLGDFHLIDGNGLGIVGGAAVGILVYQFIHYWYHRAAHKFDFLWRLAHQMHHSAESVEAIGAYYLHPVDVFFFTTWSSLVFYPLLGLRPEAGLIGAAFLTFNAVFQHANIKTPRWVGYIVQRPESHGIHHEKDVHRYNYADLPLVDMIFGTFRNPRSWEREAGFYKGASSRILEMLTFQDVSTPKRRSEQVAPAPQLGQVDVEPALAETNVA